MKKPIAVIKYTDKGLSDSSCAFKTVRRFSTVKQAEEWIGNLKDKKAVKDGLYSIDGPEE